MSKKLSKNVGLIMRYKIHAKSYMILIDAIVRLISIKLKL